MDPKKRTTIIVLLFLTILLGVVSVFITTQIQRNNAVADGFAGNLTTVAFDEIYSAEKCDSIFPGASSYGIVPTGNASELISVDDMCEFTLDEEVLNLKFIVNPIKEDFDLEQVTDGFSSTIDTVFLTSPISFTYNTEVSTFGLLDDTCVMYMANSNAPQLTIELEYGTEDCVDSLFTMDALSRMVQEYLRKTFIDTKLEIYGE